MIILKNKNKIFFKWEWNNYKNKNKNGKEKNDIFTRMKMKYCNKMDIIWVLLRD